MDYGAKLDKCIELLGVAVERKTGRKYGAGTSKATLHLLADDQIRAFHDYVDRRDKMGAMGVLRYLMSSLEGSDLSM